jgi:hypothetical protein
MKQLLTIAHDLRDILKAFKAMDDQATEEARTQSAALAYLRIRGKLNRQLTTRTKSGKVAQRVADGVSIFKVKQNR